MDSRYSSLLARLQESGVLSRDEREDIEAELTSTRQNQQLLAVLSRKSHEQFLLFVDALDKSGQEHVAGRL